SHTIDLYAFSLPLMFSSIYLLFLIILPPHRSTLFPTRRSSDLGENSPIARSAQAGAGQADTARAEQRLFPEKSVDSTASHRNSLDRKSTRLNSSHGSISYAVFCLKKKIEATDTKNTRLLVYEST